MASFGKSAPTDRETGQAKGEEAPISNGTVTQTVTGTIAEEGKPAEVIGNVGAGDGI